MQTVYRSRYASRVAADEYDSASHWRAVADAASKTGRAVQDRVQKALLGAKSPNARAAVQI